MIIDAHIHNWRHDLIPIELVMAYLAPLDDFKDTVDFLGQDAMADFALSMEIYQGIMQANGIDKAMALATDMGLVGKDHIDIREHMRWFFEEFDTYDEFIPIMGMDPRRQDAIEAMEWVMRRWDTKGVKVYPACGFMPQDPSLTPFWDWVDDQGLLVVTHAGAAWGPLDEAYCHPIFYREVVETHPNTNFIIAHLGGKWREELFQLADCENVHTDISAIQSWLPAHKDIFIERMHEAVTKMPGRVFFGTDWPLFEVPHPTQMFIRALRDYDWASESVKEGVMGEDLRRLLGI